MIRKPKDNEALDCAKLIYISGPEIYSYAYDGDENRVCDFLTYFYNYPGMYSKDNMLIEEEDSEIKGLILGFPAKELVGKVSRLLPGMYKVGGFFSFFKIFARFKVDLYFPKLGNDEFFIVNLAVFEKYRKQGIAKKLLSSVEEIAVKRGFKKMSLFLEIDKPVAKEVYRRYGFIEEGEVVLPKRYEKYKMFGFYKMVKVLDKDRL